LALTYASFIPEQYLGDPMKRFALATSLILAAAFAAPAAMATTQQERMTQCNADAKTKNLSGDARKAFMKTCLSGKNEAATPASPATPATRSTAAAPATPAAPATQQEKMTACNKEASGKGLKGDERKTFMSTCLKG
jgi:psiF repeat-containing protein